MASFFHIICRQTSTARQLPVILAAGILAIGTTQSLAEVPDVAALRRMSLEELIDLRITTVSHRPERLLEVPAAISVITAEDIQRTGVTSIPDALRLATGMHVARANNNTWAISARGFNLNTANKMEVLIDGRSIYSPLYSGVFWDVQDVVMEDVDRIEVIRGPAGTLWGPNAVNGAIHIFTKHARDTQGTLAVGGGGIGERGFATVRQGGAIGDNMWYRVYGRNWVRGGIVLADGEETDERRVFGQGGFRIDSEPAPDDHWTLQGDLYEGRFDRGGILEPIEGRGANLSGRWTRRNGDDSEVMVHAVYDRVERTIPGTFGEVRDTGQVDFLHRFPWGERHNLVWGMDARVSQDRIENSETIQFLPASKTFSQVGFFVEDQIALAPEYLELTVGTRVGHNTYSGIEYQPNARLAWMPTAKQTVWTSVSRAVRIPARIDTEFFARNAETGDPLVFGNPDFRSEVLWAYEAGYRVRPAEALTLDLAFYYNDYDHLRSREFDAVPGPAFMLGNELEGETWGGEFSATWQASEWWRLRGGYAHLQKRLRLKPGSSDPTGGAGEGNDPDHIFFLHSAMELGERWDFDAVVRHVSELPSPNVPSYTELDLRLGWLAAQDMEISLVGRNLLKSEHREFGTTHAVPRIIFAQLRWDL